MTQENIEKTIGELSGRLEPVRPLPHPVVRAFAWFLCALLYFGAAISFIGIRGDIAAKMGQAAYVNELGFSLMLAVSAVLCSGWLAVPDMRGQKWMLAVPFSFCAAAIVWFATVFALETVEMPHPHWHKCVTDSLLMGGLPVFSLLLLVRRGNTTHPRLSALMNILAVGALGWAGLRITCASDAVGHIMSFHFLPFLVVGIVLSLFARKLYAW
jgi:hypothetical protein